MGLGVVMRSGEEGGAVHLPNFSVPFIIYYHSAPLFFSFQVQIQRHH